MKVLHHGKNVKLLFLAALLAGGMGAGHALSVGAADENPAAASDVAGAPATTATPQAGRRHGPGDFAAKHAKFLEDTRDLRRRIAVAEGAMQAVMRAAQPDINQAQRFAGELFDLREQMRARAEANGLPPMMGDRPGPACQGRGMMAGPGDRMGRGGQGGPERPDRAGGCMGMMAGPGEGHGHGGPMMGCMGGRDEGRHGMSGAPGRGPMPGEGHHGRPGGAPPDCGCDR